MITIPLFLKREFVEARPETLFVCATDRSRKYKASEQPDLEGLRNVFWVPIKIKPCMDNAAFFRDDLLDLFEHELDLAYEDFVKNYDGKFQHVVPDPRFGKSNWSGPMKERTPRCWDKVRAFLHKIETPHTINWNMQ